MDALIDIGVQHETVDLGRFSSVGKHCAEIVLYTSTPLLTLTREDSQDAIVDCRVIFEVIPME